MKSLVNEIKFQLLKSWLQVLKTLGLVLVPMLYVVILVFSVWQPLDNINKVPVSIIDTSERTYIYSNANVLGLLVTDDEKAVNADEVTIEQIEENISDYKINVKDLWGKLISVKSSEFIHEISFFDLLVSTNILTPNNDGTYKTPVIGNDIVFENVKYFSGQDAIDRKGSSKDALQLVIKDEYLFEDVKFLGTIINPINILSNKPKIEPLEIISNASHNFILSNLVDNVMKYKEAVILDLFIAAFRAASMDYEVLTALINAVDDIRNELSDVIVRVTNDGSSTTRDFAFGLGEFFLLIGISVGILAQLLVFKRKPLSKYKSGFKYYFDKWALMNLTSFVQIAVIVLVLAMTPFNQIGAYPMFLLWIWLTWFGIVFTTICTSIWMITKLKLLNLFILVSFLVLNIASGWGVFPSYMQSSFYNLISYIMPFRYVMQGEGIIIYSIGGFGSQSSSANDMLIHFASLVPFIAIALVVGYMSSFRLKEYKYGTSSKKALLQAANDLGLTNSFEYINNIKFNNWNTLEDNIEVDLIKEHILKNVNNERVFNWIKKKK